jgi:hypothetical protein
MKWIRNNWTTLTGGLFLFGQGATIWIVTAIYIEGRKVYKMDSHCYIRWEEKSFIMLVYFYCLNSPYTM